MAKERIILRDMKEEYRSHRLNCEFARRIRELEEAVFGQHKGYFPCEPEYKEQQQTAE